MVQTGTSSHPTFPFQSSWNDRCWVPAELNMHFPNSQMITKYRIINIFPAPYSFCSFRSDIFVVTVVLFVCLFRKINIFINLLNLKICLKLQFEAPTFSWIRTNWLCDAFHSFYSKFRITIEPFFLFSFEILMENERKKQSQNWSIVNDMATTKNKRKQC